MDNYDNKTFRTLVRPGKDSAFNKAFGPRRSLRALVKPFRAANALKEGP